MDDADVPAKADFMAVVCGGCTLSFSVLMNRAGVRSQYCLHKFAALRRKLPTLYRTPDFKREPAMTQLLRWAVFERKLWSGVSVKDVKKIPFALSKTRMTGKVPGCNGLGDAVKPKMSLCSI